ncbi:hypothetical protein EIP86_008832 [Pleurotus ostreatoroseus]|nr:hypothetical protein EIP86_008832 [Pleurotus ostreatoroseus]
MAATTKVFDLPLETTDEIVTYLHDDTDALQVCTLLGGKWAISARRYIFKSTNFSIDDPDDPDGLASDSAARRLSAFADFLDRTLYVPQFVQEFRVVSKRNHRPPNHWDPVNDNEEDDPFEAMHFQVHLRDLFPVLQKLPALRRLTMKNVFWSPLPIDGGFNLAMGPGMDMTLAPCPWVKSLCVEDLPLRENPNDLMQFAAIFYLLPGLSELHMRSCYRDPEDHEIPEIPFPQSMSLRSLIIKNMLTPCVLLSLVHTNTMNSLVSLDIEVRRLLLYELGRMGVFFAAVGPQLKHLRLGFTFLPQDGDEALRTLTLEPYFGPISHFPPWLITEGIIDSLSVNPSALQHLILILPTKKLVLRRPFHFWLEIRWDILHTRFLAFPALQAVQFVLAPLREVDEDEKWNETVKEWIIAKLPVLQEKGCLAFVQGTESS